MCVQLLSRVQLFVTLWTVACQFPLPVGFLRHENWIRFPFPPPRDLPDQGIEPMSLVSPALQADSSPLSHRGCPWGENINQKKKKKGRKKILTNHAIKRILCLPGCRGPVSFPFIIRAVHRAQHRTLAQHAFRDGAKMAEQGRLYSVVRRDRGDKQTRAGKEKLTGRKLPADGLFLLLSFLLWLFSHHLIPVLLEATSGERE